MEFNADKCKVINLQAGNQTGEYVQSSASIQQRD